MFAYVFSVHDGFTTAHEGTTDYMTVLKRVQLGTANFTRTAATKGLKQLLRVHTMFKWFTTCTGLK